MLSLENDQKKKKVPESILKSRIYYGLVWFGFFCLMAYQPLRVTECQNQTIWLIAREIWGVHTFLKGSSLRVNVIAQLEFQLTFYNVAC